MKKQKNKYFVAALWLLAAFALWTAAVCIVDLQPIGPNQAILAYSDFYYPDQSGKTDKKLKTILTRIITVE